jgi:hypothetical protein
MRWRMVGFIPHGRKGNYNEVWAVYPDLGIEFEKGGVKVLPCNPAITIKPKSLKK